MRVLDKKLLRDLRRLWAQGLAIALVIAGAVATLVMSVGSHQSLAETRLAYYDRFEFADVFAQVRRAPKSLSDRVADIPGVAAVDVRIAKLALLDIPGFGPPASAQFISLPEMGEPLLNRVYLRQGRLPASQGSNEVAVSEAFAKAHSFVPGSHFAAILNGRRHELSITGIVLSPEFIYAIGPGDIMPDDRRFGVVWMPEKALAAAFDLQGAFSSLAVKLLRNADEPEVLRRVDELLDPYGGQAAYSRRDQTSHAFLDHELDMLGNMSRTLPPIFLLVAAFLVNLTLSRFVALEREQIGLLKALGYGNGAIVGHYLKFVFALVAVGVAMGSAAGTWLGIIVTTLFGEFFRFPFLVFNVSPALYAVAGLLCLGAALIGAIQGLRATFVLTPAVAMLPLAPARFRRLLPGGLSFPGWWGQPTVMAMRNLARHRLRAVFTATGMAFATAILVVSLFTRDTMEQLIDVTYFLADRQDASIIFPDKRPRDAIYEVARLPGVVAAEPFREVPVRIRHSKVERRIVVSGRLAEADLSRIVDAELRVVRPPETGIAISSILGRILGVQLGDTVEIDLLEGQRRTVALPVTALVEDYFGIRGMMDADALSRLMREAPTMTSAHLAVDASQSEALYASVKATPRIAGFSLQRVSLFNFRQSVALLVTTMATVYTGLAGIIAFGVVYNSARVSLSERARELASLRVLGFTASEVLWILLLELAILTAAAQPPGWLVGYGLAWIMKTNLAGELMRVRLVIENSTYVTASAIVLSAAILSAFVVRERVAGLDLVAVLKTRD